MLRDRRILYSVAFLRAVATGMAGVLIGIYLARLGFNPTQIGLVVSAGLAGAAVAAVLVTLRADRSGRRRSLVALALLGGAGGLAVAATSHLAVMAAVAFAGMLNGMGRDRGAALILDQAILPATTDDRHRTQTFAWYNLLQDAGHAVGSLAAGLPVLLRAWAGVDELTSLRLTLAGYAGITLATGALYLCLSPAAEAPRAARVAEVSPESRRVLWRISSLFALDGLGGGFLTAALLSFFFFKRFGVAEASLGLLFFCARLANAGSHLAAAWLARRIGLVNTMVFTHVPSSLLLLTVAVAPTFPVAAALFILREGLVEMDVPTRQSYVMAVVRPEERTVASGVTHLVRLFSWAVAPGFAGLLMSGPALAGPLVVGAGMKIAYDVLLYAAFRGSRPPEERRTS
ncbi:MAG TPA: MFS transporter [Candidatus Saccharimonadales bacterium]|nr:MFS transporter [Candidatus Saccharimonadales bacterium]